jgi:hypothetical protein
MVHRLGIYFNNAKKMPHLSPGTAFSTYGWSENGRS